MLREVEVDYWISIENSVMELERWIQITAAERLHNILSMVGKGQSTQGH